MIGFSTKVPIQNLYLSKVLFWMEKDMVQIRSQKIINPFIDNVRLSRLKGFSPGSRECKKKGKPLFAKG